MGVICSNLSLKKEQSDSSGEDRGNTCGGQEEKREDAVYGQHSDVGPN